MLKAKLKTVNQALIESNENNKLLEAQIKDHVDVNSVDKCKSTCDLQHAQLTLDNKELKNEREKCENRLIAEKKQNANEKTKAYRADDQKMLMKTKLDECLKKSVPFWKSFVGGVKI